MPRMTPGVAALAAHQHGSKAAVRPAPPRTFTRARAQRYWRAAYAAPTHASTRQHTPTHPSTLETPALHTFRIPKQQARPASPPSRKYARKTCRHRCRRPPARGAARSVPALPGLASHGQPPRQETRHAPQTDCTRCCMTRNRQTDQGGLREVFLQDDAIPRCTRTAVRSSSALDNLLPLRAVTPSVRACSQAPAYMHGAAAACRHALRHRLRLRGAGVWTIMRQMC